MHVDSQKLVDSLKRSGLRVTAPRRAVCQVLATSHSEHLTAADLGDRVNKVLGRPVDPATIYRTIDVLEREGHVHHVHFGHGPGVVHMVDDSAHHHLVCEQCGHTEDVPMDTLEPLLTGLENRFGFKAGSTHFALMGRCGSCSSSA